MTEPLLERDHGRPLEHHPVVRSGARYTDTWPGAPTVSHGTLRQARTSMPCSARPPRAASRPSTAQPAQRADQRLRLRGSPRSSRSTTASSPAGDLAGQRRAQRAARASPAASPCRTCAASARRACRRPSTGSRGSSPAARARCPSASRASCRRRHFAAALGVVSAGAGPPARAPPPGAASGTLHRRAEDGRVSSSVPRAFPLLEDVDARVHSPLVSLSPSSCRLALDCLTLLRIRSEPTVRRRGPHRGPPGGSARGAPAPPAGCGTVTRTAPMRPGSRWPGPHARRIRRRADRSGSAVEHRAVGGLAAATSRGA